MSGHSKWHNIQMRKGAQDTRKASAFTRVARAVMVAARQGGGNPDTNFALRLAIEKAREVNMPKGNIDRAIKKGTGEDKEGAAVESALYEGYGPAHIAVIVEAITDNKNRTAADMKSIFSKHGGAMGAPGSVAWQFERAAAVHVNAAEMKKINNRDAFELALIDAGASDIVQDEDVGIIVYAPTDALRQVTDAVRAFHVPADRLPADRQAVAIANAGLAWRAKEFVDVSDAHRSAVENFFEALDAHDDVQEWYTNAK